MRGADLRDHQGQEGQPRQGSVHTAGRTEAAEHVRGFHTTPGSHSLPLSVTSPYAAVSYDCGNKFPQS